MSLDKKRKELELGRVIQARKELEFRIEERQEEIKRLLEHIQIQKDTETKLENELKNESKG